MAEKVLLVDDDQNALQGYYRNLHKLFAMEVALGGVQALQAFEGHGPFAVVVADMGMPGMSGLDLLSQARQIAPDTTRIMLTGYSDQKTAMDAVNRGHVFRFLTKPCSPEELRVAIEEGIHHHRLRRSERELLEQTLMGSIQVLSELLASSDPESFGRSQLVRERVATVGRALYVEDLWSLEAAALLAPIGKLALPRAILAETAAPGSAPKAGPALLQRIPEIGARLLESIPRMETVAAMVRFQDKGFDGSGCPVDGPCGRDLPQGARILKAVGDLTRIEQTRHSMAVALAELELKRERYDPEVLAAIGRAFLPDADGLPPERELDLSELREGMVLARSIVTVENRLVLVAGLKLGKAHLQLLESLHELIDLREPFLVTEP